MDCFRIPEWELMEEYRMEITDVRVRKIAKEGKMKAIVSITFDDEFVVHDIKVIEGEKGLFIAMPSKKASDGEYRDIAHPINSNTRDRIQSWKAMKKLCWNRKQRGQTGMPFEL